MEYDGGLILLFNFQQADNLLTYQESLGGDWGLLHSKLFDGRSQRVVQIHFSLVREKKKCSLSCIKCFTASKFDEEKLGVKCTFYSIPYSGCKPYMNRYPIRYLSIAEYYTCNVAV